MLELTQVHAAYGVSRVLHGVSLTARAGEVVSLLGRNGAGKSSTLKAIMGLIDVTDGDIRFEDQGLRGRPTHEISRLGVGWVPEDRRIFSDLTVEENLRVGEKGGGVWTPARVYGLFPKLGELARRRAGSLSGGEQQMLTVARTLMGNPIVLLLDEPSEGLAPIVVARIGELLKTLRATGATTLIAEQNMHFCLGVADDAVVIDKGAIVYRDTISGLKANEEVRRRYLAM